jgi:hypothetical protein
MRSLLYSVALLASVSTALAQPLTSVPPGTNPETGARPGNEIGTKSSLPRGNTASNINESDVHSRIAPNLPTPRVGDDASPAVYLKDARNALSSGRTGAAQEALERAETSLLNSGVQPNDQSVQRVSDAREALAGHDRARAGQDIDGLLNSVGSQPEE